MPFLRRTDRGPHIPWGVALLNAMAAAVWTVGVFASLYAGYLRPRRRPETTALYEVVRDNLEGEPSVFQFPARQLKELRPSWAR